MTDQEQLKYEHRDRIVDACVLAIRHAALLLSPAMQKYADEMIFNVSPSKLERKPEADGPQLSLMFALEKLSALRKTNAWVSQRNLIGLLTDCWCGVAEGLDRQSLREGKREGEFGPLEQEYQQMVVKPLIEQSFKTLWEAQAALKRSAKISGSQARAI